MNSWDCFDTLIGRTYKDPKSIFDIVSKEINDPLFTSKRILAEKQSIYKTYEDIYRLLPEYDPSIEIETEKKYSFPIIPNFNKIRDGDIVVSDMYLSENQIMDLLIHHGMNKDIKIIVSYSGKHNGVSWNYIKQKYDINYHIGDNIFSDVKICRRHGFSSILFGGARFTEDEIYISKKNYTLASLMRRIRLSNPYNRPNSLYVHKYGSFQNVAGHIWIEEIDGNTNNFLMYEHTDQYICLKRNNNIFVKLYYSGHSFISNDGINYSFLYSGTWIEEEKNYIEDYQKLIWSDQSQFNIPILVMISNYLPKDKKIIFSQRDCTYLNDVYRAVTKNYNTKMLDVSRNAYYSPFNEEYIKYILAETKDALIVDSHGSGNSANHFFRTQNSDFKLHHVCKHPVKRYTKDSNILSYNTGCNRSFHCYGRFFEKHNISYNGPLLGWENNMPIRGECEHDKVVCDTINYCIQETLKYIDFYSIRYDQNLLLTFLNRMKHTFTEQFVQSIQK